MHRLNNIIYHNLHVKNPPRLKNVLYDPETMHPKQCFLTFIHVVLVFCIHNTFLFFAFFSPMDL